MEPIFNTLLGLNIEQGIPWGGSFQAKRLVSVFLTIDIWNPIDVQPPLEEKGARGLFVGPTLDLMLLPQTNTSRKLMKENEMQRGVCDKTEYPQEEHTVGLGTFPMSQELRQPDFFAYEPESVGSPTGKKNAYGSQDDTVNVESDAPIL